MDPLSLSMIMGGAGLLKGELFDRPREANEQTMKAYETRYSPWTKIKPRDVNHTDSMGQALVGANAGYQMGDQLQTQQAYRDWLKGTGAKPADIPGNLPVVPAGAAQAAPQMPPQAGQQSSPWSLMGPGQSMVY